MGMLAVLKSSVKIKISVKSAAHSLIDDVLEPALEKIVQDSSNPFDNMLKASVYPSLEKELKILIDEKLDDIILKIPESIRDFIEIV